MEYVRALSIAGSDSGGGAGIQADLKTMSALGVYASTVITAVTVQNTVGVSGVHIVPADVIASQIRAVVQDIRPQAVKIGMLADAESMRAVCRELCQCSGIPVVLDPVMVATSGDSLMQSEALGCMKNELLPLCTILTPNIPEAEALSGLKIHTDEDKAEAARRIFALGAKCVLIKGGHMLGAEMKDSLYVDGQLQEEYSCTTVATVNTHGTGCTLSSAIAACLAKGEDIPSAVRHAKEYITEALSAGADVKLGEGHGSVNHFFSPKPLIIR